MASDSAAQLSKYLLSLAERSWLARQWIRFSVWMVGLFFRYWCRLRIEGGDQIPDGGGVLLASNHVSLLDALLIPYTVMQVKGLQIVWSPAKEELFKVPVLGRILLSWGSFPVRRGRGDFRAMRRILEHLSTAKMMLFPEGTRSPDGKLQAGNRTVGKFIYQAQPIVIPTAISGTDRILPKGARFPLFRQVITVRYGAPLALQHHYEMPDSKQTSEAIIRDVMQAIAALQQLPDNGQPQ